MTKTFRRVRVQVDFTLLLDEPVVSVPPVLTKALGLNFIEQGLLRSGFNLEASIEPKARFGVSLRGELKPGPVRKKG